MAESARPHAVTSRKLGTNGPVTNTYQYDANGNMTDEFDGNGALVRHIVYDYDNMPSSITKGADTTSFVYDVSGRRVKKIVAGGATTIYIGDYQECAAGGACTNNIFAGGKRLAYRNSEVFYYHQDHLGSSRVVTTGTAGSVTVKARFNYRPFGDTIYTEGSENYKYTSQGYDAETGLYYYNARYYNPALGRFISADSIVPDPEDPQAFNRYSYTLNNPVIYTDPTGNEVSLYSTNSYYGGSSISINYSSSWYYTPSFYRPAPAPAPARPAPAPRAVSAPASNPAPNASTVNCHYDTGRVPSPNIAGLIATDLALGISPYGIGADFVSALTGKTAFGGFELAPWERGLGLIPFFSEIRDISRARNAYDFAETTFRGRPREIMLQPGTVMERAFEEGYTKPVGLFTTRGATARRIQTTSDAVSELALRGTSDARPNFMSALEVMAPVRAQIGFIKDGGKRAMQIVIHPEDIRLLREIGRRPLEK